jgi:hypothetical protein
MCSQLNEIDKSTQWPTPAIEKGYGNWEKIKSDGDLDNIREDSEYLRPIEGR